MYIAGADTAAIYVAADQTRLIDNQVGVTPLRASKNVTAVTAGEAVADFIQDHTTAACEVIRIQQDDISEGTINFVASDRGAVTTGSASVASVVVELNG